MTVSTNQLLKRRNRKGLIQNLKGPYLNQDQNQEEICKGNNLQSQGKLNAVYPSIVIV